MRPLLTLALLALLLYAPSVEAYQYERVSGWYTGLLRRAQTSQAKPLAW